MPVTTVNYSYRIGDPTLVVFAFTERTCRYLTLIQVVQYLPWFPIYNSEIFGEVKSKAIFYL